MEGPSLVILTEELKSFTGKRIEGAFGSSNIDYSKITGSKIKAFKSWGKHFLIVLEDVTIRIHFLMFGSYRINERKNANPRLSLQLENGDELNFYTTAVRLLEENLDMLYDWSADVMSDQWNARRARKKLKALPDMNVCDALLDQQIFSGVGNIIKNEVLYRIHVHPENTLKNLPARKLTELITEARNYSFDFYTWKKAFELKKHWLIHTKKKCKRCNLPALKNYIGKTKRRTFYCNNCQVLYT